MTQTSYVFFTYIIIGTIKQRLHPIYIVVPKQSIGQTAHDLNIGLQTSRYDKI